MLGCDDPDPSNSLLGSILQPSNLLTDTSSGDSSCREQGGDRYFISTPDLVSFSLENNGSDHPVHSWRTLDYSGVKYEQQQTDQLSLHEGNDESSSQTTSTDAPGAFLIRNGTSSGDGNRGENSTRPEILNHDQGPSHVSSAAEILAELCMEDLFMPPSSNAWSSSVVGAFDRPPPPPYPFTTTSSQINESQIPSSISSDSPSSQANTKPSSSSPSTAIAVASSAEHYTPPKQLATPVACVICGEIFNSDMELELHHTSHSQRDLAKALTSMTRSACNLNPLTSLGPSSTFLFSTPLTPPIPSPSPTPPPNESHQNSSITTSCKTTFTRSSVSCNQTEDSSSLPSFSSTSSASSALLGNNSLLLPGGVQISPVPASLNPPVTTSSPLSFLNLLLQNQTSNPSPHKSITFTSPSTVSPLKPPSSNLLPPPPPYPLAAKTLSSAPFCSEISMTTSVTCVPNQSTSTTTVSSTLLSSSLTTNPLSNMMETIQTASSGQEATSSQSSTPSREGSTAVTSLSSPPPNASHSDSVKIADGPSSTADATSVTAKKSLKPSRQPIPCPVCGKVLANQGNMKKHMTVHDVNTVMCDQCGAQFHSLRDMRTHLNRVHGETPTFTCEECGKTFVHQHYLKEHKATHQPVRLHECKRCGRFLKSPSCLRRHLRRHDEDKRDHKCPHAPCQKAFHMKFDLQKHLRATHRDPEQERIQQKMAQGIKPPVFEFVGSVRLSGSGLRPPVAAPPSLSEPRAKEN